MTHTVVVFIIHVLLLSIVFMFAFFSPSTECKLPWRHSWQKRWEDTPGINFAQQKRCSRCNKLRMRSRVW